jgi:hypothetical protein
MPPSITIQLEELAFLAFDQYAVLLELELQIRNLHFNRAALQVCARLKRAHRIFHREPMRHQLPNVAQQPRLHESYRLWPHVRIPILEPEVHLPRRQSHERELHLVLSDADDEHGPAEPNGVNRSADRGLSARALQRDVRLLAAHRFDHPRCQRLWCLVARNVQRAHTAGRKRFGEREARLIEVSYNEWVSTRRTGAEHCRESDRPRATYERRVAEPQIRAVDSRKRDRERFEERAVLVGKGRRELVTPYSWVGDVAAEQPGNGRRGAETVVLAAVVAAFEAWCASVARDPGLDCDAVAWLEMGYGLMYGDDLRKYSG